MPAVRQFPIYLLATAAESPTVEPSARAPNWTACYEAATHRTTTHKAARSRKSASVGPSVISVSPAVIPGAGADKDAAREPPGAMVAGGREGIGGAGEMAEGENGGAS